MKLLVICFNFFLSVTLLAPVFLEIPHLLIGFPLALLSLFFLVFGFCRLIIQSAIGKQVSALFDARVRAFRKVAVDSAMRSIRNRTQKIEGNRVKVVFSAYRVGVEKTFRSVLSVGAFDTVHLQSIP